MIPALLWTISALIGAAFAVRVGIRFWRTRRLHHAAWFVGFALYTFTALASALAYAVGWNPWMYKLWYVAAAALVAFLGAGELYFVARPRWAHAFLGAMVLVALAMLVKALNASVDLARLGAGGEIGGEALPGSVRLFSPLLTIPGSLALIGGALWSGLRRRSVAGLWVAAGSLIMASGGTLTRFGMAELLPVANSVGVVLLYAGYVIAGVRQMESGIVSEKTAG